MDASRTACTCLHAGFSGHLYVDFYQDYFSLSSLSGEVGHHTRWHNWILIFWHLLSRKTVHSSKTVVSNPSKPPQGLGFLHNSLSCWCHIRQAESPAMCSLWIRLCHVASTASLGFLIGKIRITGMGWWRLSLSGVYICLICEFFKSKYIFSFMMRK